MCGIAGVLNLTSKPPPARAALVSMIETLHHRGPDGFGYYQDADVGLAHARLSIIDIAGGKQPIHNEDNTVWVTFNGEIFNYIELRRDLERLGHSFYTQSDTEVIVHAYEAYGDAFVQRLNGQFAIALWDVNRKRLVLARDRVGIRPLFHATVNGRLYFASEIKALLAITEMPRRLSLEALGQTFTYWSALAPATAFDGIQSLAPGHLRVIEAGRARETCYWDWAFPTEPVVGTRSEQDYAEELRALLVDAVRLQLRADVPVAAYLSGGLDSSAIAALIKGYTSTPLRTFSVGFEDAEFDEGGFQRQVVTHLDTQHSAVTCRQSDIRDIFPRAVWHAETPLLRTAPAPLMLLAGSVRTAGYKVVLTGEGADEVFGGYDLFKEAKIRRFWARAPGSRLRPAILARLYPYLRHSPAAAASVFREQFFRQGLEFQHRATFAHVPRWQTTQRIWRFLHPDVRAALHEFDAHAAIERQLPADIGKWSGLARDQYVEAHTLLSGYLLSSQGDRMAMAHSVEGRFPYLDHRVIEFAAQLPPYLKIRGLTEKYLLKKAVANLLPASISVRTKQPYRAPDAQSFFDGDKPVEYVAELFSQQRLRESGIFDPEPVRLLYEKCQRGQALGFADNMAFVGVLSTLLVDDLFIRRTVHTQYATRTAVG